MFMFSMLFILLLCTVTAFFENTKIGQKIMDKWWEKQNKK